MIDIKRGFSNLAKYIALLVIIYIVFSFIFVLITVYDDLKISPELWNFSKRSDNQYVFAIISPTRYGENQQAKMIKETAEKQGYLAYIYTLNDKDMDMFLPAKYMNELLLYVLNIMFKPDLHLAISFHVNLDLPSPKAMYISVPPQYYIERVEGIYPYVNDYNKFLDINLVNKTDDWLSPILKKEIERYYGIVGVPANDYKASDRKRLLLFGSLWGRKTSNLYASIRELAKNDYMYFIRHKFLLLGLKDKQQFSEPAVGPNQLQERLNQYGIGLCIHSKYHNKEAVPSSRIFEIISSGAIAISDKNPFVIKFFGDNVLYFDQNGSAEEIYKQIDEHVRWVQENPIEAEIKAKNAHKILQEKFTTEKFIHDMIKVIKE
ncbi:MAG: glycosyltransferase [Pseudomonadota bacterium]